MAENGATAAPDQITQMVERMTSSTERMKRLIEDLLAYSVVRGGELQPGVHHLEQICADVIDSSCDQTPGCTGPRIDAAVDAWVLADPTALKQVMANLVGNAIKYAAPGDPPHIELSVGPVTGGLRRVRVADRGIGLPPGQEEAIFEEFHRVAAHAREHVGTGLGLAICRRVVERHGGSIHATNRADGGLIVEFTIPDGQPTRADRLAFAAWRQARAAGRVATAVGPTAEGQVGAAAEPSGASATPS